MRVAGYSDIFIDIFPFDNIPDNKYLRMIQNIKTYISKRIILIKSNYVPWDESQFLKKYVYTIIGYIMSPFCKHKLIEYLEYEMKKYNLKDSKNMVTFGRAYGYKKESIPQQWIKNLIDIDF